MTVREFCEKYTISHQAVYKKIKKLGDQLDGHVYKRGCLWIDPTAEDLLKPHYNDYKIIVKNSQLRDELYKKESSIYHLEKDVESINSENDDLKKSLDEKMSENADLENQLAVQISKNDENDKTINRLSEDIAEKNKLIEELRSANAELTEQLNSKSGGVLKSLLKK